VHRHVQAPVVCVEAQLQRHLLAQRRLRVDAVAAVQPAVVRRAALLTKLGKQRHKALAHLQDVEMNGRHWCLKVTVELTKRS
jgi:hypothetical protein